MNDEHHLVVVLGMHRSGTSALTRALTVLGVELGETLLPANPEINAKGFWEDTEIVAFNDRLLAALGLNWSSCVPIERSCLSESEWKQWTLEAIGLLRERLALYPLFGFKDPRTTKLAFFWREVMDQLNIKVSYLLALRHPMSVARSLQKRDAFALTQGYMLWYDYQLSGLEAMQEQAFLTVDYDQLMEQPLQELHRVADFLNIEFDPQSPAYKEYVETFLDTDLRHTCFEPQDLTLDPEAPVVIQPLYEALLRLSRAEPLTAQQQQFMQQAWVEHQQNRPLLASWDQALACVQQQQAQLGLCQQERLHAVEQWTQLDAEREHLLAQLSQLEAERAQRVKQQADYEAERVEWAQQQAHYEAERMQQAEALRLAQHQYDHALHEIYHSRSWRVTAPLRALLSPVRRAKKLLWVYRDARQHHSLMSLWHKAWGVLRHEGIAGLKRRAVAYWQQRHPQYQAAPPAGSGSSTALQPVFAEQSAAARAAVHNMDLTAYDVVSFDVFDTLLVRLLRQPTDLFRYIEQRYDLPGFYQWRITREQDERRLQPQAKDISLEDIYRDHPAWLPLELESERLFCVANPEIYELYRRAVTLKKRIFIISDMYLRHQDVAQLLDDAGYSEYETLLVSSHDQLVKGDGSRFRALEQDWAGCKVLHVGDHAISDAYWPRELGFDALHYQEPDAFFAQDALLAGLAPKLKEQASTSSQASLRLSHLLGAYRYWKLGIERSGPSCFWRSVGFLYAGPLVLGFVQSMKSQLQSLPSLGGLYFLARDGDILKKVFDLVYAGQGYQTHYLYASRRCMTFPLFDLPQQREAQEMVSIYAICDAHTNADEVFKRFGYPELTALQADLQHLEQTHSLNVPSVKQVLQRHAESIRALAAQERTHLLDYLRSVGFFEGDALLVDVGWSGTIQDSLTLLAQDSAFSVNGAYLGVWPEVAKPQRKQGYLFNPRQPQLAKPLHPFVDFMELLTSSPLESVKSMTRDAQGQLQPTYFPATEDEQKRQLVARELQQGVLEYVHWSLKEGVEQATPIQPEEFVHLCEWLSQLASEEVKAHFDQLRHSRMLNGGHHHEVLSFA